MQRICVDLLEDVHLTAATTLVFANGDSIELPAGQYWTAAFGVVVDVNAHSCIASGQAKWKLQ